MKKILALVIGTIIIGNTYAQDDFKKFRFGLKLDPSISWFSADNKKKLDHYKAGMGFAFGAMGEIGFAPKFSLTIGAGLSFDNATLNYYPRSSADSVMYILNGDEEFQSWTYGDSISTNVGANSLYTLNNRKYMIRYFYLPVALKMKTKQIGMMTYFGQFGLDIRIKTRARVDDNSVSRGSTQNTVDLTALNVDKGVQLLNLGLNIGAGVEYNISGTTSLVGGISYVYGLTNTLTKNYETLAETNDGFTAESIDQVASLQGLRITIGVLF